MINPNPEWCKRGFLSCKSLQKRQGMMQSISNKLRTKTPLTLSRFNFSTKNLLYGKDKRSNNFQLNQTQRKRGFYKQTVQKTELSRSVINPLLPSKVLSSNKIRRFDFSEKRSLMLKLNKIIAQPIIKFNKIKMAQAIGLKRKYSSCALRPKIVEENFKKSVSKPIPNPFSKHMNQQLIH